MSSKDKVPIIGELMTSRWAFEAAMVTQFKENRFEKPFYELDKKISNSEYRNLYYIPALMTKLNYCNRNFRAQDPGIIQEVDKNFALLSHEIGERLAEFGTDNLTVYSKLNRRDFNEEVYKKTDEFLKILKRVYIRRYNEASDQKEVLVQNLTNSPEKRALYDKLKQDYNNDRIEDMVKKNNEVIRIIEYKNKLVQKIYPIFQEPTDVDHFFDFRTIFYAPTKYFAGSQRDTLWFNIGMIWFMTVVLFIALYFDLLRKIVLSFNRIYIKKRPASV
jgi:hypothetical protein